jgi:hypothetical protein
MSDNNLFDFGKILALNLDWSSNGAQLLFYLDEYKTIEEDLKTVDSLKLFLNIEYSDKKLNFFDVNSIKSCFDQTIEFENYHKKFSENYLNIIDCTNIDTTSAGNLNNLYYRTKEYKSSFLLVFSNKDINEYAIKLQQWQMRSHTFMYLDDDLNKFKLFLNIDKSLNIKKDIIKSKKI